MVIGKSKSDMDKDSGCYQPRPTSSHAATVGWKLSDEETIELNELLWKNAMIQGVTTNKGNQYAYRNR